MNYHTAVIGIRKSTKAIIEELKKASPAFVIVISLTALVFSYRASLSAADIVVDISPPQWAMRPVQLGDSPNSQSAHSLVIKLTCAFSNRGARNGVVNDILLRLESMDDSTRWLFYPAVQVDDLKFLSSNAPVPANSMKGMTGSVYPVAVAGKQSQVSTYVFLPMLKHPNFPYVEIKPHRFRAAVLTRTNGQHSWDAQQTFTVNFDQQTIDQINSGVVMQLFPDELDELRREVK